MESGRENRISSRSSTLRALATQGGALLSALPILLGRRPREARLQRLDTKSSRNEFQGSSRSEMSGGVFAGAKTFRDLFQMLDVKRALWGTQKRYTAQELKILINRVRTTNPQFHLPLEVIPETNGLRERVKVLAAAEALTDKRNDHR